MLFTGILIGLGALLALALGRSYARIDEGSVGVITTFGAAKFVDEKSQKLFVLEPGLHLKLPWQKVLPVKVMEQNLELSGESGGRRAMANDGTILRFDSVLRYEPLKERLATFLFGMRAPLEHMTGVFTCLLRSEIANFRLSGASREAPISEEAPDVLSHGGSYAVIRRERQRLNRQIEEFSRDRIGATYGVQFNAVDLVDILPPDELADALNAVINAQMEAEAAYFRAEGDCQQRVLSAERGVEIARSRAKATAVEITKLCSFLQELQTAGTLADYVARRRSEVMNESKTILIREKEVGS